MKKLISVALVFLMVVSLLASCGKKNQTLKEAKVDGFVDRFVDAAKEAAKTKRELADIREAWPMMTMREKKNVLHALLEKVVILDDTVTVYYTFEG